MASRRKDDLPPRPSVLIDGLELTGEASRSGIGTYVRELVGALAAGGQVDLTVMATADAPLPAGAARRTIHRHWRRGRLGHWEHEVLRPLALWSTPAEVRHTPSFAISPVQRSPWVATLHDVAPLVIRDDPLMGRLRAQMLRFGRRLEAAAAVIAISRFAADTGIRHLGLDSDRVHVIHHGVARHFTPEGPAAPADRPYLLVVSEYQRRKGFDRAFGVIDQLADAGYPHVLKVAGRVNPWVRDELAAMVASASHPDRVELLGFVDDLPSLYRGAVCTLIPSHYEGFGLPVLEAMASGSPIISFDNSALAEVVASGGLLVADGDVAGMAAAVRSLIDSTGRRQEQVEAGLAWSRRFTWEACAQAHAEVYQAVAESG